MPDHGTISNDALLRAEVQAAVETALHDDAPAVGVAVSHGCVLLTGVVTRTASRAAAVDAAFWIPGVTTVYDAIAVHPQLLSHELDAADVARGVAAAIAWAAEAPDSVRAEIWDSTAVLTGTVRWDFERQAACRAVALVTGIEKVDDRIRVSPPEVDQPGTGPSPSAP